MGIGPGLGMELQSQNALKLLIQEFKAPMVFDADALNILSKNKTWLSFIPQNSILTPHPKEFERLVGKSNDSFDRVEKQEDENPTIGIILCKDKSKALVEMTLPKENNQIFASKYKLYLPTQEELKKQMLEVSYLQTEKE